MFRVRVYAFTNYSSHMWLYLGLGFMHSPIILHTCEANLTLKSVGRVWWTLVSKIFSGLWWVDGYGAAAGLDTTTIFNAGLFCNKQCHVATIVAAALLVGNWTSLPSKLFAQKNWWKFWTHTHTPNWAFPSLPCLWCVKLNTDFPCCTSLEMGKFLHCYQLNFISFYKREEREREREKEKGGRKEGGSEGMERHTTTY